MYAIKPHLEDGWSKELEEAWLQLFRVMSYYMKKGMQDANVITYWMTARGVVDAASGELAETRPITVPSFRWRLHDEAMLTSNPS